MPTPRSRSPRRGPSPPARTSSAWTSRTAASPTRCSTISTGRRTIRSRTSYDDTGWTFGELFNVKVVRVTDVKVLDAPMETVKGDVQAPGGVSGTRRGLRDQPQRRSVARHAALSLQRRADRRRGRPVRGGRPEVHPRLVHHSQQRPLPTISARRRPSSACRSYALAVGADREDPPGPRGAHRDDAHLDQHAGRGLVAPGSRSDRRAVRLHQHAGRREGRRTSGPSTTSSSSRPSAAARPGDHHGHADVRQSASVEDDRADAEHRQDRCDRRHASGPGLAGLANLQKFVREGGVLITVDDTASFAVQFGLTPGVSVTPAQRLKVTGAVLRSKLVDGASPIAYGYETTSRSTLRRADLQGQQHAGGRGGRGAERPSRDAPDRTRHAGRSGSAAGTPAVRAAARGAAGRTPGKRRRSATSSCATASNIIPPAQRPRVVLRYARCRELLVSGLLDGGAEIAQRPMVSTSRSRRGTSCCSRTIRSGAVRRRAATSWCSTRS